MRIRTIKPELWSSPSIVRLSLRARLLFLGLLNYADDEGRGRADPALIRGALYPLELAEVSDADVLEWLRELHRARLVTLYRASPRDQRRAIDLLQIRGFLEHQRVDRPRESRYPAPRKHPGRSTNRSTRRSTNRSTTDGSKEVEKEKEVKTPADASANGAGVYDPEAVYVPGPDDPKLFDEPELEPTETEPTTPKIGTVARVLADLEAGRNAWSGLDEERSS
jgi:hypothetical protein